MTCADCQHYRPNRYNSRCTLHRREARHDEHCGDHAEAPRETVAEYLARGGSVYVAARAESGKAHDSNQFAASRAYAQKVKARAEAARQRTA
jgi:hypothetical protein